DEREFDYSQGSEKGPGRWGELKKEWAACKNGEMQSPIDMSNQRVEIIRNSRKLEKDYKPSKATVKNRGHDIMLEWAGDAGSIHINDTEYHLRQAHWHSPSEHSINGRRYALELHMVHQNTDLNLKDHIAVNAVLYKIGKPDWFLSKLVRNITSMNGQKYEERISGVMDPKDIKMGSKRYYRYMGSLTVPPCTEGVIWTINKKVRTVSKDQVYLLREAVHDVSKIIDKMLPSTSQPSPSLPAKNAFGDVKDQAEDEANLKPWYTTDEKSSKMSTEDLVELLREYPLPVGWYARLLGLQEPANYGTKYETGIYEEQVKSGYRLPLHPFALRFFEHYHMASGKLPFDREWNPYCKDFENPGKPAPNNLTKHILSHIKLWGGLSINEPLSEQQLEWARIIPRMPVLAGVVTPPPAPTISSTFSPESASLVGVEKQCKEAFLVGSEMLSSFKMARQVATEEAQQKREAVKEVEEATRCAEELSKQETYYLAQIETLERRLEQAKMRAAEEVKKARDQGIRDILDGNAGDEWLKKRADDSLEIYKLGFAKAKEMFVEHFPDISLDDFILPAVISLSGETVLPSEAGNAAASHPPGEGPSGVAPKH
ncbi:hypothetical protein RJ639_032155, partial [Escallonia herrerae]